MIAGGGYYSVAHAVKLRFEGFTLDVDARRLLRGSREIRLSPKAFELLKALGEAWPRALTKQELLERIWPGVFVSDVSLARTVTELRGALGDRAREGRIVRTVYRYGYAFAAEVQGEGPSRAISAGASPVCWLTSRNRTYALADGEHIAGREPGTSIWLDSPKVSRHHARVVVHGARATIEDLNSTNGTFVQNARISAQAVLDSGDTIRIGPFTLMFRIAGHLPPTEPERHSR
jgi:DNA-binding winged helix-turn-helix (wHTH) protein